MGPRRLIAAALVLAATTVTAAEDPLHLNIGDPARKDREAALALDGITETATGSVLTPAELPARLSAVKIVLLGEGHTEMESHRVERRVLEELVRAGRRVSIGLEMYPYPEQPWLDSWIAGKLSEKEFLGRSRWYKNWGYNWGYYRDIFLFAGEARLPTFAVNTPREVISAVRRKGFSGLTEEEAAHVPAKIDTESPEHLRLFKASVGGEGFHAGMGESDWKAMFAAQCAWDATMARNAVSAFQKSGPDEKAILVLLAGAGHVQYGLGIQRQASLFFPGKIATLIAVPVRDEKRKPVATVRASYADFLWGVAAEENPLYPSLGISTRPAEGGKGLAVLDVEKKSAAERAGLAAGDVLLSIDATPTDDREAFNRLVAEKSWGDAAHLAVRRGDAALSLTALFRRDAAGEEKAAPR